PAETTLARTVPEILERLQRGRGALPGVLHQGRRPAERVPLLAAWLRSLWPEAHLFASLLWEKDRPHCAAPDGQGTRRPDRDAALAAELSRLRDAGAGGGEVLGRPEGLLVAAAVACGPGRCGVLAVGTAADAPAEEVAALRAVLAGWADHLALLLRLEE